MGERHKGIRVGGDPMGERRAGIRVVGIRWESADSAPAVGPSGLRSLKSEPGAERPACAGLPVGAPSAGALDEEVTGSRREFPSRVLGAGRVVPRLITDVRRERVDV